MHTDWRITLTWAMKRLPFVTWDRCVGDGLSLKVFGWIGSDFIVVEYITPTGDLTYITSAANKTHEIEMILFGEHAKTTCMPVATLFNDCEISNVIKL